MLFVCVDSIVGHTPCGKEHPGVQKPYYRIVDEVNTWSEARNRDILGLKQRMFIWVLSQYSNPTIVLYVVKYYSGKERERMYWLISYYISTTQNSALFSLM